MATSKLYVGMRAGYFTNNHTTANVVEQPLFVFMRANIGFLDVPSSLQQVGGFQTDLTNTVSRVDRLSRVNAQIDATYFGSLAGQHMLKGGVQFDRRSNDVDRGQSANQINLFWDIALAGQRGRYGYYRVLSNPIDPKRGQITFGNVHDTIVGLFVQDAWTVGSRLTVNAGLRTENETVPFYSETGVQGIEPIHFSFGDKLAPRAGAAWDVAGNGLWKVHGSWGVFYDIFKLAMPQAAFGGPRFTIYSFKLETYDWPSLISSPSALRRARAVRRECPCVSIPSFDNIDPDLEPMRMQELTLGVEHQMSPHVAVSARFVHKQLDRAVEDIGSVDADGNATYVIGNPGYRRPPRQLPACRIPRPFAITMPWSSSREGSCTATGRSRRATSGAACTAITRAFRNPTRTDAPSRTSEEPSTPRSRCSAAMAGRSTGVWPPTALTRSRRNSSTRRPSASTSGCFSRSPAACQ